MADEPPRQDDGDELLERADAFLARHRGANITQSAPATSEMATPPQAGDMGETADVPTLTEIVIEDPPVMGRPGVASAVAHPSAGPSPEATEVMSRLSFW